MEKLERGCLLRIFMTEDHHLHGKPLYQYLLQAAKERGLKGATVWRGMAGYGVQGEIHTTHILRLSEHLPIVVEIVDQRSCLEAFLADLAPVMSGGMATLEDVDLIQFKRK